MRSTTVTPLVFALAVLPLGVLLVIGSFLSMLTSE